MQSISAFLDITKAFGFRWNNLLSVRYNSAKFQHCKICATHLGMGTLLPCPSVSSPDKAHPE